MEGREMPGDIRPEVFSEPFGGAVNLRVAVVLAGNEQRRDFKPNTRFAKEFECLENRGKAREAKAMVKFLRKRLQIHVRRIHVPVEFRPRIGGNVASCHRDSLDARVAGMPVRRRLHTRRKLLDRCR